MFDRVPPRRGSSAQSPTRSAEVEPYDKHALATCAAARLLRLQALSRLYAFGNSSRKQAEPLLQLLGRATLPAAPLAAIMRTTAAAS